MVIFAKAPLPGQAKTRLIPALGEPGAAALAQRMLAHTVAVALAAEVGVVELCVTPAPAAAAWQPFRHPAWPVTWQAQGDGDLGERLARASQRHLAAGVAVLLIGTDCPQLEAGHLREAAGALRDREAVMLPSTDGGYVLLGLRRFHPSLFQDIAWSTATVAAETLARLHQAGYAVARLPALHDIDEPGDLAHLPPAWRTS